MPIREAGRAGKRPDIDKAAHTKYKAGWGVASHFLAAHPNAGQVRMRV
jgi:hypothetical protein